MIGSSCGESGVKNADLMSFKNYDKSSSFIFFMISSNLDSLFVPELVWAVFNPSTTDSVLSTRTLGLDPTNMEDNPGSASAMESAEASSPDALSLLVAPKDVGLPAACCASLCISPTTKVGVLDLDASIWDSDVCFEDCFLLRLLLSPGFLPWGTSIVYEEGFGALETTCTSNLQISFIWVVKEGSLGCEGYRSATSLLVVGNLLKGDEGLCDDDSSIMDS
ncbi:hypothetical protein Tco_0442425 [Tanacetum coccineum]